MLADRQAARQREAQRAQVQEAVRDTYTWVTEYTKTFNEHWQEEGRPSPYEPFPRYDDLAVLFDILDAESERIIWIEKSRDMGVVGLHGLPHPEGHDDARMRCSFPGPERDEGRSTGCVREVSLRPAGRLSARCISVDQATKDQPALSLNFAHGGYILGIPGGADQIRSYHPWGYLNDESSFQPEAGECYNEALSAVKGKIIFNSSAGPGWYADARRDIIRNGEDQNTADSAYCSGATLSNVSRETMNVVARLLELANLPQCAPTQPHGPR